MVIKKLINYYNFSCQKKIKYYFYLLGVDVHRRSIAVTLAVNGGVGAAADGVALPLREVVVNDVDVATSTSRHPLNQPLPEMVERYRHLHSGVRRVFVVVTQKHHFVVVGEVVVGYGDSG